MPRKPFQYDLPERLTHEEYQKQVRINGLRDRVVGSLWLVAGALAVSGVVFAILAARLGEYTRHPLTDLVVMTFVFLGGVHFLHKGWFMRTRFLCRFCLSRIPEGSTYCPSCKADMLSNQRPD